MTFYDYETPLPHTTFHPHILFVSPNAYSTHLLKIDTEAEITSKS